MPSVLIVDDRPDVLEALRMLLKNGGYASELAESPERAIEAAANGSHDLVMMDMNYARDTTSGAEGLALLETLRRQHPDLPVLVMTAWSTIDLAVEAMRRGASGFIPKPWENGRVLEELAKYAGAKQELSRAGNVQRRLLAPRRVRTRRFEANSVSMPAGEIGGDLCDVFGDAFLVGDVSGKGTAAALLMANLHASVRSNRELGCEPSRLMARVNTLFFEATTAENYATMFFGYCEAGLLRYVNCGHPAAMLMRAGGEMEMLDSTSTVLGAFEDAFFEERAIAVQAGDRLVIVSDGVTEARPDDEEWVANSVRMLVEAGSRELAASLAMAAVNAEADDVTVLDIRFL